MKRMILRMIVLVFAIVAIPVAANAQSIQPTKADYKSAKKQVKTLEKEGWKCQNSRPMEDVFARHYAKTSDDRYEELIGDASSGGNDKYRALSSCQQNAAQQYAQGTGKALLEARLASGLGSTENVPSTLVGGAEQNFAKLIEGELGTPTVILEKGSVQKGDYSLRMYWAYDKNKADQMADKAIQKAIDDFNKSTELGNNISDFIHNGQNVNN